MNNTTKFHNENNCTCVQESIQNVSNVLYTVQEVAQLLKTNIDYVYKLRKARILPFLKIGQYKVRKQSLEQFLEQYEGKYLTDPFNVKELS